VCVCVCVFACHGWSAHVTQKPICMERTLEKKPIKQIDE